MQVLHIFVVYISIHGFVNRMFYWLIFGQGLFKTLQTVLPGLRSDVEAIQIAFREKISGRMPENRGNGLKFVLKNIQEKSWDLYYHSGNAICYADASDVQFNYSDISYQGCMALISF